LGLPDQAWELAAAALERGRSLGKDISLSTALVLACQVAIHRADIVSLQALAEELAELGRRYNRPLFHGYGMMMKAEAALALSAAGSPEAMLAAQEMLEGFKTAAEASARGAQNIWFARMANACLHAGSIDAGLAIIDDGLARLRAANLDGSPAAELYRLRGELLLAAPQPNPAQSEMCLRRAIAAAHQGQALTWELRAATALARLLRDNRAPQARQLLLDVMNRIPEGRAYPDPLAAQAVLDSLEDA
jgi:hypothetical protein